MAFSTSGRKCSGDHAEESFEEFTARYIFFVPRDWERDWMGMGWKKGVQRNGRKVANGNFNK